MKSSRPLVSHAAAALELAMRAERQRCEASLIGFVRRAWREIEPGDFVENWHHRVICGALEAMAYQEIRNCIINVPPRHSKSLLCSVMLPAWIWCQPEERWSPLMGPHVRFLCVSYGATLSEEIALKMKRLVEGEWYQRLWSKRVKIRADQKGRANFANVAGGERISSSIEGGLLGKGGDWQLLDDVHSVGGAESDQERRSTLEAMRNLITRVTNPQISARLLIMQRLHNDDATNYALENWSPSPRHIMLPARFDIMRADPADERTEDGELLWPEIWSEEVVASEERELTEYGKAGQLQQMPVPRGGGIIKREWWRLWPDDAPEASGWEPAYRCIVCRWSGWMPNEEASEIDCPSCGSLAQRQVPYPPFSFRMVSVDTAYGEKDENSFSAATSWGIWHGKDDDPRVMLTEAWRGRPKLYGENGQRGLIEQVYAMATRPNRQADLVLIEKKTRGVDLKNELERAVSEWPFQVMWFEPTGRGDKVARLTSTTGMFVRDLVWAPAKTWADLVVVEVTEQPRAKYSDLSDTVSQALIHMRNAGLLMLGEEHKREKARAQLFRPQRQTAREMVEEN